MKFQTTHRAFMGLAASSLLCLANLTVQCADYHALKEIPVGGAGGFDYLTVDSTARRLYVSHGTKVVVIDIEKDAVIGEVTDTPGIHGIAIAPDLKRGFTRNGREAKASVFDPETLKPLSKVETGPNPDAILYEPGQQEVYTFNGRGNNSTVIEGRTGKVVATIALSGKPEFATADPKAGRVYCNNEKKNEIVGIQTKSPQIVKHPAAPPREEDSGRGIEDGPHPPLNRCPKQVMGQTE